MTNQTKTDNRAKGSGPVFDWRQAQGYTQAQAAKVLKCHVLTIKRCEAEARAPAEFSRAGVEFQKALKKN